MKTIKVTVKAMVGDSVMVNNHKGRKANNWEIGTVISVDCKINNDETYLAAYRVRLHRRAIPLKSNPDFSTPIYLTAFDSDIKSL